MRFNELLELLEIENLDEFGYFEHFAALVECDEEISYEMFYKVLSDVDTETLLDLTDNYFEDILQGMPDDGVEIYTLFSTIKQALMGHLKASSSREDRVLYVDELFKFRTWYIFDSVVTCKRLKDDVKKEVTLSEALSLYRSEKLNEDQYSYDFSECLDYDLDEYTIPIDAAIDEEYDDILEEDEDLYEDGLIDRDFPVIDGEDYEEEEDDYEDY
ncbi:hypothetical protein [Sinanaerobacter chloroacetimidivorans]|uniref:Uncharacterized protein n=1 Tax=Sinanaerobacter chloroacetimidivorans TaxID=2818044 RepID=A0A8J7W6B4_9FIRM|nr:hypothetical protein [Sinanaerobacter chloroacetimidivorans]MBR0600133.1 hypothetical protein [Sinanaerobacter chloroacetimidivorans]